MKFSRGKFCSKSHANLHALTHSSNDQLDGLISNYSNYPCTNPAIAINVLTICRSSQQAILQALDTNTSAFQTALDQYIDWTPEAAAALEDSIRSGPIEVKCSTDQVRK